MKKIRTSCYRDRLRFLREARGNGSPRKQRRVHFLEEAHKEMNISKRNELIVTNQAVRVSMAQLVAESTLQSQAKAESMMPGSECMMNNKKPGLKCRFPRPKGNRRE
jgi:hypothetical protein